MVKVIGIFIGVWMVITIMPLLAQENPLGGPICWAKITDCATNANIDPAAGYAMCCPVIKPQVANTTCFCSIKDYIKDIPHDQPAVLASQTEYTANKLLSDCKIDTTFDQLCNVSIMKMIICARLAGVSKDEVGGMKSGAMKMTGSATLLAGALFALLTIMAQ